MGTSINGIERKERVMVDQNRGEQVYEDHSTVLGRVRYRSVATGLAVAAEDAGEVVEVKSPPISAYFSFRSRD